MNHKSKGKKKFPRGKEREKEKNIYIKKMSVKKEQKGVGKVKPLESLIRLHFYVISK